MLEFWQSTVLPEAQSRLDELFPDFAFRRIGKGWEATNNAAPWVAEYMGVGPSRLARVIALDKTPGLISVAGGEGYQVTSVWRHTHSVLRGKAWVEAVLEIAETLGLNVSPFRRVEMTDAERAEWAAKAAEAREKAAAARKKAEAKAAKEERDLIAWAQGVLRQARDDARDLTEPEDQSPIMKYLAQRGRKPIEGWPQKSGVLFGRLTVEQKAVTAILCPAVNDRLGTVTGMQRVFVTRLGDPQEVQIDGEMQRKAGAGVLRGAACRVGQGLPEDTLVLCEGWETGVAVHEATGLTVWPCISAGGLVSLELSEASVARIGTVIIAADLDSLISRGKDKIRTGTWYAEKAAERLRREYGLKVGVMLPERDLCGVLVAEDGSPAAGRKGVDWEDVLNALGPVPIRQAVLKARGAARGPSAAPAATPHPPVTGEAALPPAEGPSREEWDNALSGGSGSPPVPPQGFGPGSDGWDPDEPDHWVRAQAEGRVPRYARKKIKDGGYVREPYGPILPASDLELAHEYLLARWAPETVPAAGGGLRLCVLNGERLYRWTGIRWVEEGDSPLSYLRGDIRRYFEGHCQCKMTREKPPSVQFVDANLSMTAINAIAQCVVDEVNIISPRDEFSAQFLIRPNLRVEADRTVVIEVDRPAHDRMILDGQAVGLPSPEELLPIRNGLLDLGVFQREQLLVVRPHTPLFFNRGACEIELPVGDAAEALASDGVYGLKSFASGLCPEWVRFLEITFRHADPKCVPQTTRELHKVLGAVLTGQIFDYQRALIWLVGAPGNGKSLVGDVFGAIVGASNTVSSTTTALMNRFHLKSWIGKRLARFPDMDVSGRVDKKALVEMFKMLAAKDPVAIDRKNLDELASVRLEAAILASVNTVPNMPDPTLAIMRRSIFFHFKNRVVEDAQDHGLGDRLCAPGSLAGIVLLALCGVIDLATDGRFIQPEWSKGPLEDLKAELSPYDRFIELCIDFTDASAWLANEDTRKAMVAYMAGEGRDYAPPMSTFMKELRMMLEAKGWSSSIKTQRGGRDGYAGLRLTPYGLELATKASAEAQAVTVGDDNSFLPA